MPRKPLHVSIVLFPECDPSIVYGIFDTLWAAGRLRGSCPDEPLFEPRIASAAPGPLKLYTGVTVVPQDAIAEVADTDMVIVPNVMLNGPKSLRALDRRLLGWIARQHGAGRPIYSSCGGSLVLAEAGLLDGGEATTHWSYVPLFRREFPRVRLHPERILVQTGEGHRIVSAGGASSWQDLSLYLVARHAGNEEAIRLSKLFLYQWHREGQLPYASMMQNVDHGDHAIERCQGWLADNYACADPVGEMVRRAGLAKRTFDRRFRNATGYAPLAYVQALRIEEAKQELETGDEAIEAIGEEVGYADPVFFRRLFRRLTGMTPAAYRKKFKVPGYVAAGGACSGTKMSSRYEKTDRALQLRPATNRAPDPGRQSDPS